MSSYQVPVVSKFVWQMPVEDKDSTSPPVGPSKGDRYIVGASATGDWSGHDDDIAYYDGSSWQFLSPSEGWTAWVKDEDAAYQYDGSDWEIIVTGGQTYDGTTLVNNSAAPTSWTDLDISNLASLKQQRMLVYLKAAPASTRTYSFRTDGETQDIASGGLDGGGCTQAKIDSGNIAYFTVLTSHTGVIEWKADGSGNITIVLLTWTKVS